MTVRRAFSVAVYPRHQGRVLLIRHRRLNLWLPPGGELLPGESPLEAARRELFEETGLEGHFPITSPIDGTPPGLIGYEEHPAGSKGIHFNFVFVVDVSTAEVRPNDEFDAWRWVEHFDDVGGPPNVAQLGRVALAAPSAQTPKEPSDARKTASPPIVRPATLADVAALVPLLLEQQHEHRIPARAENIEKQTAALIAAPDQGFVLLAELAGAVVGVAYVSFARPLEHAGEVAWLEELYVAPSARGGVGQALVAEVIARAEARGCVSVDLEVSADHARAANLYTRNGFRSMQRDHFTRPLAAWDWGKA